MNPLSKRETKLIDELWHDRDVDHAGPKPGKDTKAHLAEREKLVAKLAKQRKRLQRVARLPARLGGGWNRRHRGTRFQIIHKAILFKAGGRVPHEATDIGARACHAGAKYVGLHETGYNDSSWLRKAEAFLVKLGHALGWMIPGNPYCGFGVIVEYEAGPRIFLPDNFVGTYNILPAAGRIVKDHAGRRYKLTRVALEHCRIGDILPMNFGSGGAKHVGIARGHMANGMVPTREWNTSPSNAGSQSNGGGVYDKWRSRGMIMGALRVEAV